MKKICLKKICRGEMTLKYEKKSRQCNCLICHILTKFTGTNISIWVIYCQKNVKKMVVCSSKVKKYEKKIKKIRYMVVELENPWYTNYSVFCFNILHISEVI